MRRDRIEYYDDMDGKLLDEETMVRVPVSWLGIDYELQVSPSNFAKLEKQFKKMTETATRVGGRKRQPATGAPTNGGGGAVSNGSYTMKDVREWAKNNDIEVNPKGRVPDAIIEQYEAAAG
ncbi:Lsr2-like DNA bridging protein [Gordonia phage Bantam]|uniref:Lsr2-like DNA bridging protein n=1 Tax=Gordonia phage Bantam TaxID=1887641 RepID=A0A1B3AYB5_9CAUD|nr:nucloid associated Lsr2-like [Gordonia phage Bantam]AOE43732.1 Lsr2-like DNA bridging protein [Gordonia phage Bantam]